MPKKLPVILLLLMSCLFSITSYAQSVTIKGNVKSAGSGDAALVEGLGSHGEQRAVDRVGVVGGLVAATADRLAGQLHAGERAPAAARLQPVLGHGPTLLEVHHGEIGIVTGGDPPLADHSIFHAPCASNGRRHHGARRAKGNRIALSDMRRPSRGTPRHVPASACLSRAKAEFYPPPPDGLRACGSSGPAVRLRLGCRLRPGSAGGPGAPPRPRPQNADAGRSIDRWNPLRQSSDRA